METETLNVIIAFLAFVFAIGAGAVVYANAADLVKKADLAKFKAEVRGDLAEFEVKIKGDLAKVEEHVNARFDKLEADFAYIKERVGGGKGTGAGKT